MKFRIKMTLCMLGLLSILFGAGGSLLISASFHTALDLEGEAAYGAYQMVLGTLQIVNGASRQSGYGDISHTLDQLSNQNTSAWMGLRLSNAHATIYQYGKNTGAASAQPAAPGSCAIRYRATETGGHVLELSGALETGDETLYLDITRDVSQLYATRQMQQQTYRWVFFLMAALCGLLSYSLSRVLTEPLVSLSQATRAIASGKLSCRARIRSQDEIGQLAADFNAMAETLEENIFKLRDAMERQERFMGSFAHELKTPMTSIIGYADLIRGQTLSLDEETEAANYIVLEGKRLENLSRKLLDILVLKKGEETFQPIRPGALIRGLAAHLSPVFLQQNIQLTYACEEGACLLEPDLVKSLLINLLDNARKALADQGGRIHIQAEMLPDGCRICVRDNGPGVPPAALAHLTEAFYRVDKSRSRAQGGVGLGLALCQEIVALHRGELRFESRLGQGTAVLVELRGGAV